jgi:uncharacterized protein involved in response to NO
MASKPIEIRIAQPRRAAGADDEPTFPPYKGPAFLSYGFRPFFFAGALFAGFAVPIWVLLYAGIAVPGFLYPPREWHVHEMLFGFLPAIISGFLMTAVPNWTGRLPFRGMPLLAMASLWLAGRVALASAWPTPLLAAITDALYLVALAIFLLRELIAGRSWGQAPVGIIIALYAMANMLFHARALAGLPTDLPERLVLGLILLLLTVIGGRLTPNFTREFFMQNKVRPLPPPFSLVDGISLGLVVAAVLAWIGLPQSPLTGPALATAGAASLIRLGRWRGWLAWREPLVLSLHVGFAWLGLSLLALGSALLGFGLQQAEALHLLTAGAVGTMTLAVMTRATLGHTGRPKQAGPLTVTIYLLVTLGTLLRVCIPNPSSPTGATHLLLGLAAMAWSGAYLLFALTYGSFLFRPSLGD